MSLWGEIRRRNVHRVAIAYVAAAWQPFLASVGRDPDFLASVEFNPTLPAEIRLQE